MHSSVNQHIPFEFRGPDDDPEVYSMYKNMATPGFQLDMESLEQPSVTITFPNDGHVVEEGSAITINFSHIFPNTSATSKVLLKVNELEIPLKYNQRKVEWVPEATGPYYLRIVVYDDKDVTLYQSAPVDIEVSPKID
jgi:hypothetical protein